MIWGLVCRMYSARSLVSLLAMFPCFLDIHVSTPGFQRFRNFQENGLTLEKRGELI